MTPEKIEALARELTVLAHKKHRTGAQDRRHLRLGRKLWKAGPEARKQAHAFAKTFWQRLKKGESV
jgi:hypothetical protein